MPSSSSEADSRRDCPCCKLYLSGSGYRAVTGSFEYHNKSSGSKDSKFFDYIKGFWRLKKESTRRVIHSETGAVKNTEMY
jgi:hypothetical protein